MTSKTNNNDKVADCSARHGIRDNIIATPVQSWDSWWSKICENQEPHRDQMPRENKRKREELSEKQQKSVTGTYIASGSESCKQRTEFKSPHVQQAVEKIKVLGILCHSDVVMLTFNILFCIAGGVLAICSKLLANQTVNHLNRRLEGLVKMGADYGYGGDIDLDSYTSSFSMIYGWSLFGGGVLVAVMAIAGAIAFWRRVKALIWIYMSFLIVSISLVHVWRSAYWVFSLE